MTGEEEFNREKNVLCFHYSRRSAGFAAVPGKKRPAAGGGNF